MLTLLLPPPPAYTSAADAQTHEQQVAEQRRLAEKEAEAEAKLHHAEAEKLAARQKAQLAEHTKRQAQELKAFQKQQEADGKARRKEHEATLKRQVKDMEKVRVGPGCTCAGVPRDRGLTASHGTSVCGGPGGALRSQSQKAEKEAATKDQQGALKDRFKRDMTALKTDSEAQFKESIARHLATELYAFQRQQQEQHHAFEEKQLAEVCVGHLCNAALSLRSWPQTAAWLGSVTTDRDGHAEDALPSPSPPPAPAL